MPDYFSLLARKIDGVQSDPAETRWLVYELARQSLRKQAYAMRLSAAQTREQMADLEAAIARLEAEARRQDERHRLSTLLQLTDRTLSPEQRIEAFACGPSHLRTGRDVIVSAAAYGGVQETYAPYDRGEARPGRMAAMPPDETIGEGAPSRRRRRLRTGAIRGAQLTLATVFAVALYAGMADRPATSPEPASRLPNPNGDLAITAAVPAPTGERSPPLPTMYGVYAVRENRLVELEQIPTGPVDSRLRQVLQTTKPSHARFSDGKLAFVVFRRDLLTSAPEKVSIRILAKIARMTNFDAGKAATAAPPVETWLIRETGYDFRVLPVRQSQEMIAIRPEDSGFAFPPGRYALMLNGQPYEFSVDGVVTDPSHCVESFATARGPAFNECR